LPHMFTSADLDSRELAEAEREYRLTGIAAD
jgi:hypothetical protein